jgi:FtsZ-interacting cell division protein ZipA
MGIWDSRKDKGQAIFVVGQCGFRKLDTREDSRRVNAEEQTVADREGADQGNEEAANPTNFQTQVRSQQSVIAILNERLSEIISHIRSPLLRPPNVQEAHKRNYRFIPSGSPRRSHRLAVKARSHPAPQIKRSQRILMEKIGICQPE